MSSLPFHFTATTAVMSLGWILSAHSQVPARQPARQPVPVPVRAVVGEVFDSRTTANFNSRCYVELKFTGDAANESMDVIRVHVRNALDDLNRDLVVKATVDNEAFLDAGRRQGPMRATVQLRNPSRNASFIKLLEGEVELFNPTPANGGVVVIKDFINLPPAPIQNPTLLRHEISVLYLTKAVFEARRAELHARYKDILAGQWEQPNAASLYIHDPNNRVASFEVQDPNGTSLGRTSKLHFDAPLVRQVIQLRILPPVGSRLHLTLTTPETKQTVPFKLEKILLP